MINNKSKAINIVNQYLKKDLLTKTNTSYSKINKGKMVWWFNINPDKFKADLHLLLQSDKNLIWIEIPKNTFENPSKFFRIRKDKNVVDIEIGAENNINLYKDVKSGGTSVNFERFIKHVSNNEL